MGRTENPSIWEKIQRNVQETERLIGQKKYNLAMIKARQTMEYMVKLHCDKAGIVESTPDTMIRELYSGKWISKSTAEHYLQILSIGEQAAKDGDKLALKVFDFTGRMLGRSFADFVAFSAPEAIVLFGGLARAKEFLVGPIEESMNEHLLNLWKGKIKIVFSQLKESDAAILGASALAWELDK